ncbi:MAG TPA: hypothetical protein VLA39_12030 [Marinobacterium sp.]|nr:hypothetical protein [Marinobacterium sp.]
MTHRLSLLFALLTLTGCMGSGTVPQQGSADPVPATQTESSEVATSSAQVTEPPSSSVEQVVVERESTNIANQMDQLMGRLTLLQEQVINQRALVQQQLDLSQAILQRVQLMTNTALIDETQPGQTAQSAELQAEQLDAALNQLLQIANELQVNSASPTASSKWGVASAVTSKGWILIRYRLDSGESWIAEKGSWTPLKSDTQPPAGNYAVQIERRDSDSKGYVAVRINRESGDTWWLNDRTWQAY